MPPENAARTRLFAGARWIRTAGPCCSIGSGRFLPVSFSPSRSTARLKRTGEGLASAQGQFEIALGDFELALRGVLGDGAPLSASSIERLRAKWQLEYEAWRSQRLDKLEVVYAWADGLYVKAGLEDTKAALLVIVGALRDGRKVVLAIESGQRESKESWARVLRDLFARGLRPWKVTVQSLPPHPPAQGMSVMRTAQPGETVGVIMLSFLELASRADESPVLLGPSPHNRG